MANLKESTTIMKCRYLANYSQWKSSYLALAASMALLISLLFSQIGCGITSRIVYSVSYVKVQFNVSREVRIFAPTDAKIYFGWDNDPLELYGIVKSASYSIPLNRQFTEKDQSSAWHSDATNAIWVQEIGRRAKCDLSHSISIKVLSNEKVLYDNTLHNVYGVDYKGDPVYQVDKLGDMPIILKSDFKQEEDGSNYGFIYSYDYKPLVIEALGGAN